MKLTKPAKFAALTAITVTVLAIAPAMAFDLNLNSLANFNATQVGNTLSGISPENKGTIDSVVGWIGQAQTFAKQLQSIGGTVAASTQGAQGIPDFDKLFAKIRELDPNQNTGDSTKSQGEKIGRQVTDIAAAVGTAPLTQAGQQQNANLLSEIANQAALATTATQAGLQSNNSLEAIKNGMKVTNAATQQMANYSYLQAQTIQVGAANVRVNQAVNMEMKTLNNHNSSLIAQNDSIVAKTQSIPLPLLSNR